MRCGAQLAPAGGPGSRDAASPRCRRRDGPAKGGHQLAEGKRTSGGSGVLLRITVPGSRTAGLNAEVRSVCGFVEPGTALGRSCTGFSFPPGSPCPSVLRCVSPTSSSSSRAPYSRAPPQACSSRPAGGQPPRAPPRPGPRAEGRAVGCPPPRCPRVSATARSCSAGSRAAGQGSSSGLGGTRAALEAAING